MTNGYLQRWADKVRAEVVRRTLGPSIRDEVVALKAIARQCLGEAVPAPAPPGGATAPLAPVGTWTSVEQAARSLLSETEKSQWLSDLAAVRQSDDAEPQLVDTVGTRDAEEAAVASPWLTLTAACGDKRTYAATLAAAATGLRDAIEAAAQEQVQTVQDAVRKMEETLDGTDLADVAKAAREAGDRALDKNVFRPADGWGRLYARVRPAPHPVGGLGFPFAHRGRRRSGSRGGGDPHAVAGAGRSSPPEANLRSSRSRSPRRPGRRDPGCQGVPGQMTPETTSRPRRPWPLGP